MLVGKPQGKTPLGKL